MPPVGEPLIKKCSDPCIHFWGRLSRKIRKYYTSLYTQCVLFLGVNNLRFRSTFLRGLYVGLPVTQFRQHAHSLRMPTSVLSLLPQFLASLLLLTAKERRETHPQGTIKEEVVYVAHSIDYIQLTQFRGCPSTAVLISVSISVRISVFRVFSASDPLGFGVVYACQRCRCRRRRAMEKRRKSTEMKYKERESTKTGKLFIYPTHVASMCVW